MDVKEDPRCSTHRGTDKGRERPNGDSAKSTGDKRMTANREGQWTSTMASEDRTRRAKARIQSRSGKESTSPEDGHAAWEAYR